MSKDLLNLLAPVGAATLLTLGVLPACNLGPGGGGGRDDDDAGDDDDAVGNDPIPATVTELMTGAIEDGDLVVVTDAIVTTPLWNDEDDNAAGFWIQQGSGPNSGIMVFTYFDTAEALAADLDVGDRVTITGTYSFPFDFAELTVTQASQVVVTGTAPLPTPHLVDASDIEAGFAEASLIGVLVEVRDVEVEEGPGYDNYFDWSADGVLFTSPRFGDDSWTYADVMPGFTLDSVVGVLHNDFGNATVWVRSQDDLVYQPPGCAELAAPTAIQQMGCRGVEVDDDVILEGLVVISGETWFGGSVYAMDPAGAAYSGTQVFWVPDDATLPAIGDEVSIEGEYETYRGQTEVVVFDEDDVEVTGTQPVVAVTVDDICDIKESLEGMLVQIVADVELQAEGGFGSYAVTDCPWITVASEFFTSDDWEADTPMAASTIEGLVGVVTDRFNEYRVNPRDTDDWTTWAE